MTHVRLPDGVPPAPELVPDPGPVRGPGVRPDDLDARQSRKTNWTVIKAFRNSDEGPFVGKLKL